MTTKVMRRSAAAELLLDQCSDLQLSVMFDHAEGSEITLVGPTGEHVLVDLDSSPYSMIEQVLRQLRVTFRDLPLHVRGDSKEIRLLTPRIALARLLPTVYSFTNNRYGEVRGTDEVRTRFTSGVFRRMASNPGPRHLSSAFLALIESDEGPLLAERRVEECNLEVRVKRYHIGSPVHRYRYTERHPTVRAGPPLQRWSRFAEPVVCFDWRHPLVDEQGARLADEPISDDYAAVWMEDVPRAKALARDTFRWLEDWFFATRLHLIDICFFIDRHGATVYGEISPDCMRVRSGASDNAEAFDKDEWRSGGDPDTVLSRYQLLYTTLFPDGATRTGGNAWPRWS